MESKPGSFNLSAIDLLGTLIPGLAWFLLLATAAQMATGAATAVTPVDEWTQLTASTSGGSWLASGALIAVVASIGYALQGRATHFASILSRPLLRRQKRFVSIASEDTYFPYLALHSKTAYHAVVVAFLSRVTGVDVGLLPGNQPFTTAKRFLRLASPPLWADLERIEAEVRLFAGMLTAALASIALAVTEILRAQFVLHVHAVSALVWLFISAIMFVFLADSFCRARVREVDYAYVYTLLSAGFQAGANPDARSLPRE